MFKDIIFVNIISNCAHKLKITYQKSNDRIFNVSFKI